jgi:hypothetical protein
MHMVFGVISILAAFGIVGTYVGVLYAYMQIIKATGLSETGFTWSDPFIKKGTIDIALMSVVAIFVVMVGVNLCKYEKNAPGMDYGADEEMLAGGDMYEDEEEEYDEEEEEEE